VPSPQKGKTMHRFFIKQDDITNDKIMIENEDVQHISKVLRLKEGENIILCDQKGTDYNVVIESISKQIVKTTIISKEPSKGEPTIDVVLYQGIPKSTKMDLIIQKCTEMGITRVVPVFTNRTIVKLESEKDEAKKVARWTKIAEEAAKQSARGIVPHIEMPMNLEKALMDSRKLDITLIPYELERDMSVKAALQGKIAKSVGFFVGPEGGFDTSEIDRAKQNNVTPVTLGSRIMRTETAGFAMLTCIMYEYDQMKTNVY
jgi:16S rRNA (uracil1498-N3)-methyltransferase